MAAEAAVLLLPPFIEGSQFIVRTGDQALKWILDWKESSGRFVRWQLCIVELELDIVHCAGIVY